jgi:hypothetical protein
VYTSELNADPYKEIKAIRSKNAAPAISSPLWAAFFLMINITAAKRSLVQVNPSVGENPFC